MHDVEWEKLHRDCAKACCSEYLVRESHAQALAILKQGFQQVPKVPILNGGP